MSRKRRKKERNNFFSSFVPFLTPVFPGRVLYSFLPPPASLQDSGADLKSLSFSYRLCNKKAYCLFFYHNITLLWFLLMEEWCNLKSGHQTGELDIVTCIIFGWAFLSTRTLCGFHQSEKKTLAHFSSPTLENSGNLAVLNWDELENKETCSSCPIFKWDLASKFGLSPVTRMCLRVTSTGIPNVCFVDNAP